MSEEYTYDQQANGTEQQTESMEGQEQQTTGGGGTQADDDEG